MPRQRKCSSIQTAPVSRALFGEEVDEGADSRRKGCTAEMEFAERLDIVGAVILQNLDQRADPDIDQAT
ncbi:hypothetical protein HOC_11977 [Hyphomonas oceanitis SCH89]|uniref:Uncharacterized protein n=1 Tax=Hyphomonas oceanitis SCH89 TaxID=1280953 RepID=A0A059G5K4_9PROT|nr:hypothetical protein HOC_11977 [Hyphomonas oceanitis SCH89]